MLTAVFERVTKHFFVYEKFFDAERHVHGNRMTDRALLLVRRNDGYVADLPQRLCQRVDARRIDAVIIADKNFRLFLLFCHA